MNKPLCSPKILKNCQKTLDKPANIWYEANNPAQRWAGQKKRTIISIIEEENYEHTKTFLKYAPTALRLRGVGATKPEDARMF
jgi:hypothetical protein